MAISRYKATGNTLKNALHHVVKHQLKGRSFFILDKIELKQKRKTDPQWLVVGIVDSVSDDFIFVRVTTKTRPRLGVFGDLKGFRPQRASSSSDPQKIVNRFPRDDDWD